MLTRHWRNYEEYMKKIFVIISILFLFTFSIYSEVNKLPSFIETSIGKFVLKYELFYTCILENDGEEIVLSFSFKRDCTKAEIEKNINDLVEKYLKLPAIEKQICLYAAENAASGKYKDIISKSSRIHQILIQKNGEETFLEYYLITEEHIYGCDFVVVKCDLTGVLEGVYLVGWQD